MLAGFTRVWTDVSGVVVWAVFWLSRMVQHFLCESSSGECPSLVGYERHDFGGRRTVYVSEEPCFWHLVAQTAHSDCTLSNTKR